MLGSFIAINLQVKYFRGSFQDPVFFSQVPVQVAVEREIARWYWKQVCRPAALRGHGCGSEGRMAIKYGQMAIDWRRLESHLNGCKCA
jgi:hypothetical protein